MLLQPKQICWNVPSWCLVWGGGDATRGLRAATSPWMLQDILSGLMP